MKTKNSLFTKLILAVSILLGFVSCEEEIKTSTIVVYVGNGGTAGKWGHITAEIGGKTELFFTPEGRDMVLNDCNSNNPNAAYYQLPVGTYEYHVTDGGTVWEETFTLEEDRCLIIELSY